MKNELDQLEVVEVADLQVGHAFHTFMFQSHMEDEPEEA